MISGIEPILNPVLVAISYGEAMDSMAFVGGAAAAVGVVGDGVPKENYVQKVHVRQN